MIIVHYHDGTTEQYPPPDNAYDSYGYATRDGVLHITYGYVHGHPTQRIMIPLASIKRIEE